MFFYYINLISFEKQKQTVLNIQKLNDHEKTFVVLVGMPVPYDRNGNGKIVKGRVIDSSDKEPIVGASIFVKSTKQGTITDIEGHFSLEIPDNVKTITVSFVGMTTREVAITPGEMTIELTAESQALDEVVVVAYGTQKKSSITGAITQVRNEELLKRPVTSVTSALEGSTPGITVTGNYGSPGSDPTVLIRGIGTVMVVPLPSM